MSHLADRFVVLLDANVLYPFRVRDALLRFAEFGLFRARWSAQIMDEWEAALLKTKPHLSQRTGACRLKLCFAPHDMIITFRNNFTPCL